MMFKTIDEIPADLRWLAENVHEWPASKSARIYWSGFQACFIGDGTISHDFEISGGPIGGPMHEYTRPQWQTARDLISGKPGWDEAPESAKILIQQDDGEWVFSSYEDAKAAENGGWDGIGIGEWLDSYPGTVLGDWRNTLEHRPTDHTNELLDGDAPATFRDLDQPLISTTVRELRINHDDGHIDVTALPDDGGVLLVDDQGGETRIPNLATLDATAAAVRRILGGES